MVRGGGIWLEKNGCERLEKQSERVGESHQEGQVFSRAVAPQDKVRV